MDRTRKAIAAVAATAVLVVVAGGSATAAALITGKQIKNGTITSADLKNNTVTTKDLTNRTVRKPDLSAKVSQSLAGGRIPSGRTVTGIINYQVPNTGNFYFVIPFYLPGTAGTNLGAGEVNFAADSSAVTIDDDASCTGTYASPSAPAGKVCVYLSAASADSSGLQAVGLGDQSSFTLRWTDAATGGGEAFVRASWAYSAP